MTKTIETLVEDIYEILSPESHQEIDEEAFGQFVSDLRSSFERHFEAKDIEREPKLYPSAIGRPCGKQHWYRINKHKEAEPLTPQTFMKFLFGDLYEALILFLAKQAGHKVEGEQDTQEYAGLRGRRDAVIDGVLTDIKSASSRSFDKFTDIDKLYNDDPFGYIDQLNYYLRASEDDELVVEKDIGAFVVIDKQLGKLCVAKVPKNGVDYEAKVAELTKLVEQPEPPERTYEAVPDGKSGNMKLKAPCSYCDFKKLCWPGLRTFIYSNGPRYLTEVKRKPDVFEAT